MYADTDWMISNTGNISVLACGELIENDSENKIWGWVLRIENNSDEQITLLKKNFYVTDERGHSLYDCSDGFNGELPDLQPGEYFEYEQTASIGRLSAVLYGFCSAVTAKGKELKINLPVVNLSSEQSVNLIN